MRLDKKEFFNIIVNAIYRHKIDYKGAENL